MIDEEKLSLLKSGVSHWNAWRSTQQESPHIDLSGADLSDANLNGADLHGVIFREANLRGARLRLAKLGKANLTSANFSNATLRKADLSGALLSSADFRGADLRDTNLSSASLGLTDFTNADLSGAELNKAFLMSTRFESTILNGANINSATVAFSHFTDVDLSKTRGVAECRHFGPSAIDHRTLQRSGSLPFTFLRGAGLPDRLIEYLPSIFEHAIQHFSCFISYSSKDQGFADRLHADLQGKGVRCWFAPHDLPIGAKTWDAIDQAIRLRDKLLLILSEHSIDSDWVEDEVTKAFAEERQRGQLVLFPVRIDDAIEVTQEPWAVKLRDQRNIGDFRSWKDHSGYERSLKRLLRDLTVPAGEPAA